MASGKMIYQGSSGEMIWHFNRIGHQCEFHDNPADFVLDLLIDAGRNAAHFSRLLDAYTQSTACVEMRASSARELEHIKDMDQKKHRSLVRATARPFIVEILYVAQRTLRNSFRDPALFLSHTLSSIIVGLMIGLVFYDLKKTLDPGISNRLGAIFFIVVTQIFNSITGLEPLLKQRALFLHVSRVNDLHVCLLDFLHAGSIWQEYANGYYRIGTFFIAKVICDMIPLRLIPSIFFSSIVYFMVGLQRYFGQFMIFFVTVFMASIFGSAFCFFVSASVSSFCKYSLC
jgi:ATP-binding cassette, subfamily G (WHITE), member 2